MASGKASKIIGINYAIHNKLLMKATIFLIALCIIGFVYVLFFVPDPNSFIDYYGFSTKNFFERPWISLSSIFLHGSVEHLISNVLVLLFFGLAVEKGIGPFKFLALFFMGAFAGDLMSMVFYSPGVVSIGASAGIFTIVGIGMITHPIDLSSYPLFVPLPLIIIGSLYIVYNIIGFMTAEGNISYVAHFGGLIVGLIHGFKSKGLKRGIILIAVGTMIVLAVPYIIKLMFG